MSVKIELRNDCPGCWVPAGKAMQQWLDQANDLMSGKSKPQLVSIRIVNEQDAAELNKLYRGKPGPTNVLSFPSELPEPIASRLSRTPLGDIALCAPVITREAEQQGKSLDSHWAHMLTHGFLHLQGYDHLADAEAEAMEQLETRILAKLGYPNPY